MTSPDGRIVTHGESLDLTKHSRSFKCNEENPFLKAKDMARDSAIARDRMIVVPGSLSLDINSTGNQPPAAPADINQEILENSPVIFQLKKEQEMQKQMLIHSFQEQKKQLELQHKLQLEHKYQFAAHSHGVFQELRDQKIAAEEQQQRERREREREAMKRKENCSANASPEVKQILMCFLMNKKQAASSNGMTASPYSKRGVVKSSSGESLPAGTVTSSHPYKIPQPPSTIVKYDSDFPLRKTDCNSTPDSGPNSPPSLVTGGSRGSPTSQPIQEENEDVAQYQSGPRSSINDLSLFSSPSMPNISLGRPHLPNAHTPTAANYAMLTALRQQAAAAQPMIGAGAPTYYNPLPPYDHHHSAATSSTTGIPPPSTRSNVSASSSSGSIEMPPQAHAANTPMTSVSMGMHPLPLYGQPITDVQVAHARLNKQGHRPLGRTQSAPLPLGHPMLTGTGQVNIAQTHYENSDAERQAYEQQHMLLTQKIRQTVLTRSGRDQQQQQHQQHQQLKEAEESTNEVIDLTDKKQPPKTVLANSVITSTSQRSIPEETALEAALKSKMRDQEYLQQQRELLYMHSLQVDDAVARGLIRPLSRTLSSPLVHLGPHGLSQIPDTGQHIQPIVTSSSADHIPPVNLSMPHRRHVIESPHKITTGLAFDNLMLKHACVCGNNSSHPEHSGRLQSVWARLIETGLANRCDRLRSRKATQEELQTVHSEAHALLFGSNQLNRQKLEITPSVSFVRLGCGGVGVDLDTTWNEHHTAAAARMAAGCVIDLAFKTAKGDLKNGFAVVRPPGHHAESNLAMGFCFFNSVAIAAKILRQRLPSEMKKILIVDWDVHHGNGTQQAFYDTPNVLYLSIHRHDDGNFFPGTGGPTECGTGAGAGFNVNVSWSGALNPPLGDAEYLAAFRTVVMPIAREFNPDIVLVSAGFDAAAGHPAPLGGYLVSPACFGYMTRELMQLAGGKIVLALEGGYDLPAICDSAQECVRALLGDETAAIAETELSRPPCQNAVDTLQKTIAIQMSHWPCVRRSAHTVAMSAMQALRTEREESETVTAMAGLSMQPPNRALSRGESEEPMEQDDAK
ncbi:histone deacetylase 4 isoform X6 [Eupeodes corollae]|uniref:histone deacetylase 4 isoform X6 n=1 Tax=Eupeodes corollae TaxID=290404 RepID=UPI00249069B5|nr:histone deacetylase 4 isoform X6 [Eupeodes corollae]